MKIIRTLGFSSVNLDLMYGFKSETLRSLKKDLRKILRLKPDHISIHSLVDKEENISYENINEELELEMYEYIVKRLKRRKYNQYEMFNFSKKNKESRQNLVYYTNKEYYGFGLSASGYYKGFRYTNTNDFNKYLNKDYREETSLLSKKDIMDYELMLGLRLTKGINIQDFFNKYEENIGDSYPVNPLLKNKDLIYKDGYIFINPKKRYVLDEILIKMI